MFDLNGLDLEEIATALADRPDYEHRWLINPQTGEVVFWTSDTGIDGQTPVDLDELDLISIDPLPSYISCLDMADFAGQITDEKAGRSLAHVIQGRGDEQHAWHPHLIARTGLPASRTMDGMVVYGNARFSTDRRGAHPSRPCVACCDHRRRS